MKQAWQRVAGAVLLAGVFSLLGPVVEAQTVTAVPKLDLNRFMGTWYEIARLPNKTERRCVSDVAVLFALGESKRGFQIGTSCQLKDGTPDEYDSTGKMDKAGDGRLKLGLLWPFTSHYWVLAVGPQYEWALVGSPNHKTLWILSRTPTLDAAVLTQLKANATAAGFKLEKLIVVPQKH